MQGDEPQARPDSGRRGNRLLRASLYVLVALLALGGALLGGMRLLLPEIEHLRPEIEGWVSGVFEREVRLGAIDAYWRGWTPVLRVEDVRLVDRETAGGEDGESPLRLSQVSFSIDPLKSLRLLSVQPFDIFASGASIEVVRNADGTFSLHGLGKPPDGESPDSESPAASRFVLWALAQSRLSLFDSRAVWVDRTDGSHETTLDGLTLHMLRSEDGYRFTGSFGIPVNGRVEFIVDLSGDPLSPSWTGSVYALLRDVDLGHIGLDARRLGGQRFAGRVSGEVWSTLTPGGFIEAQGSVRADVPGVVQGDVRHGVDEISTAFRIGRTPEGWELAMSDLAVVTPRGAWPRTTAGIRWTPARQSGEGIVVVNAGYVRIDDLVTAIASDGRASAGSELSALIASAPRGVLEDLHFSAPVTDRIELGRARARGRFVGLGLGREADRVSLGTASGRFEAGEEGLVADVENGTIAVNLPRWLAHPLRGEELAGTLAALPSPEGLRLRFEGVNLTTSTGTVAAHGWVLAPRDRSGLQLDLALDVGPRPVRPRARPARRPRAAGAGRAMARARRGGRRHPRSAASHTKGPVPGIGRRGSPERQRDGGSCVSFVSLRPAAGRKSSMQPGACGGRTAGGSKYRSRPAESATRASAQVRSSSAICDPKPRRSRFGEARRARAGTSFDSSSRVRCAIGSARHSTAGPSAATARWTSASTCGSGPMASAPPSKARSRLRTTGSASPPCAVTSRRYRVQSGSAAPPWSPTV